MELINVFTVRLIEEIVYESKCEKTMLITLCREEAMSQAETLIDSLGKSSLLDYTYVIVSGSILGQAGEPKELFFHRTCWEDDVEASGNVAKNEENPNDLALLEIEIVSSRRQVKSGLSSISMSSLTGLV